MMSHNSKQTKRRGVAAAEFAVCLPVIVLLLLGMIETCSMVFLKQSLAVAAYEGAHMAVKPGATAGDVRTTCQNILADRQVNGARIEISPASVADTPAGDYMTIRITAPSDRNRVLPLRFFRGTELESAAVVMKEI